MVAEDTVLAFVEFYGADGGAAAALNWDGPLGVGAADAHGEVLRVAAVGADVGVDVAHVSWCMWVMGYLADGRSIWGRLMGVAAD